MTGAGRARTKLIVTDLDRTMIYSRHAIGADVGDADLQCVEYYQGAPLSYMTRRSAAALAELAGRCFVVPSTTRTIEQFTRIDLPGAPWPFAITSNGGNILVGGVPDERWRRAVADAMRTGGASLDEVTAELRRRIGPDWVDKVRSADDLFCYLVVRPESVPADFQPEWGRWCAERGWSVSRQGRKIYSMPTAVCKSKAVAEVRSRLTSDGSLAPAARVLAAGDGGLDAEMLAAADAAVRPRHGELAELQWCHPTVTVIPGAGIIAAERILSWFDTETPAG